MEDLERLLRDHDFLKGLSAEHTRLLVSCLEHPRGLGAHRTGHDAHLSPRYTSSRCRRTRSSRW